MVFRDFLVTQRDGEQVPPRGTLTNEPFWGSHLSPDESGSYRRELPSHVAAIRCSIPIEDFVQRFGVKDLERPAFELVNCGVAQSGVDGIRQPD